MGNNTTRMIVIWISAMPNQCASCVCEVADVIYFPICCRLRAKKRQDMRSRRLEATRRKEKHISEITKLILTLLTNCWIIIQHAHQREMRFVSLPLARERWEMWESPRCARRLWGQRNYSPFLSVSLQRLQCIAVLCAHFFTFVYATSIRHHRMHSQRLASLWMRRGAKGIFKSYIFSSQIVLLYRIHLNSITVFQTIAQIQLISLFWRVNVSISIFELFSGFLHSFDIVNALDVG
jgi:hypothetical protein